MKMRLSLTTRLTLIIAAVIVIAFIVLAAIFHRSTSREFVESRQEIDINLSRVSHQRSRLVEFIEVAFAAGGWENVRKLLADPAKNTFPNVVVFDEKCETKFVTQGNLGSARVKQKTDGGYELNLDIAEGNFEESLVLVTSETFQLIAPDHSEFGRLIVLPEPVDADAGETFAGQVWRTAAGWLLFTLVVAMSVTTVILRRSLKPIARLTEAASQLRDGAIPAQLYVEGDSEFRNLIEAFNAATKTIAQTDSIRKKLISDIAHELRTPLTNINAQLEASGAGLIYDETEFHMTLRKETKLLERLVEDFQQLAISDAGQLKIRLQNLPLAMFLRDTLIPFANQNSFTFQLDISEDMNVWADEERLRQVFGNLIENSLRHQPQDLVVSVKATRSHESIRIIFSDNGPGIATEDQPYVFDRFYRAEQSRNRSTGGSGLGLSIAKALVGAMSGSIGLVTSNGPGSTFVVSLPATNKTTLRVHSAQLEI